MLYDCDIILNFFDELRRVLAVVLLFVEVAIDIWTFA